MSGKESEGSLRVYGGCWRGAAGSQLVRSKSWINFLKSKTVKGQGGREEGGRTEVAFRGGGTLALKSLQMELKEIHTHTHREKSR